MAIIDQYGAVRGTVGRYVFRKINGKKVVQSHPGPLKPKGETLVENQRFGDSSELTSSVYPYIKEFGLNLCYSYLFGSLVTYFKRVLYSDPVNKEEGKYVSLDKDNNLAKIFSELPVAEKSGNIISIQIPDIQLKKNNPKYVNAEFMDYRLELILFNYGLNGKHSVFQYASERFDLSEGHKAQEIAIDISTLNKDLNAGVDLEVLGASMEKGLLILCFGTQFFEYPRATHFLNTKAFNPAGILGAWHLEDME